MQRGARFFRAGVRMLHVVLAASLALGGVGAARAQGVPVEPAPAESLPPPPPDGALLTPIAEEASPGVVDASASPDGFSLSPEDLPLNDVLPAEGAPPVGRPAPTEAPPAPIAAPPPLSATLEMLEWNGARARRGDVLRGAWRLEPLADGVTATVRMRLPAGARFDAATGGGAAWDAATGMVEWRDLRLPRGGARALPFTLQIAPSLPSGQALDAPAGRAEITTEFLVEAAGFRATRRDALNVGNYNVHTGVSRAQGGRIALSPEATLEFAAEALATDAAIETTVWSGDESLEFSFGPEMRFGAPVTLTVQLGERLSAAQREAGVRPVLRYLPPGGAARGTEPETVPSRYDAETGELVATLTHFSDYRLQFEVQAGRLDPWKLTPNLGSVSLFRGAVNYALPLALPARMSGGAPALAFAYSSAAADGGAMDDARLGVGWSFDVPNIHRGVKIDLNYTGPGELNPFIDVDDAGRDYVLELGGVSHRLIPTGTEVSGAQEYLTENSQPLRVVRCRVGSDCGTWRLNVSAWAEPNSVPYWSYYGTTLNNCWVNDGVVTPTVQYYWQAWTPDGTRYAFGTDAESTKRYWKRNNDANAAAYQTWYVTKVMNARKATTTAGGQPWSSYGLVAEYDYEEEPRQETEGWMTGVGSPCDSRKIAYDATTHVAMVTAGNLWMTTTNAVTATFYYTGVSSTTDVRQRMTNADVMQGGKRVRRYVVNAQLVPATSAEYRVAALVEQGWTNAGSAGGPDRQLPATSFTYNTAGRGATERHVTKITNGYGGATEYWYSGGSNGARYSHLQKTYDGLGGVSVRTTESSGACYDSVGSGCRQRNDGLFGPSDGLVGFGEVRETVREGSESGTVLRAVQHRMYTDYTKAGREYETRVLEPVGTTVDWTAGVVESQVQTQFLEQIGTQYGVSSTEVYRVLPSVVTEQPEGASGPSRQTTYATYDGYGNATKVVESGYGGGGDERTTFRWFVHAKTAWVMNLPAAENVYAGVSDNVGCGGAFLWQTLLQRENAAAWNATPTDVGELTAIRAGAPCAGAQYTTPPVTAQYGYEAQTSSASLGELRVITDARGYTTTATYDASGQVVQRVTRGMGGGAASVEEWAFNCVTTNAGCDGTQPVGALVWQSDVNAQQTLLRYDAFGRTKKVAAPGDSVAYATKVYTYYDGADGGITLPLRIRSEQRTTAGQNTDGATIWTYAFVDGLGRGVRTQSEAPGGQMRTAWTGYDAAGRVVSQSVPVLTTASAAYAAPDFTQPRTTTSYDAQGRVYDVTGPDGVTTRVRYEYTSERLRTRRVDGLGHSRVEAADGLGRVRAVEEWAGDYTAGTHVLSTTTTYAYNALDALTAVTDTRGNVTTIGYDGQGRKSTMTDRDMGTWTYGYDLNGNLTRTVDAKGTVTTLAYDGWNRVTQRATAGVVTHTFGYDAGVNAVGRRVWATTTEAGGSAVTRSNGYDARGRVISATLTVSGVGAWTTRWTYDAADRMWTMTNPDGEVVTATYDAAGQALGLESAWPAGGAGTTRTLAANATYNGLGQRSSVGYGNGTTQHWRYYGQETQNWGQQHYGRLRQTCVITTAATCPDDDRDGAGTKLSLHYWYDAAGNVRVVDDRSGRWKTAGVWAGPTPTRDAYAYDALDRLTAWCVNPSAWANCGGAIAGDETYAYDAIGNLTNKDGVGYGYAASGAGSVRPHAVVSTTAGGQFSYDANGNMTSRRITTTAGVQTLTWTPENRLQRVTVGGATKADFDYDADGVRVRSLANGETTIYAAGGYEVVVAGATALTRTQYYEFGGQRAAMRVWRPGTTATTTTWLHGDALGSARAATTLSGAVAAGSLTRYTPYGQTASGGGGPSDHTFTGQRSFVDAVGLMDYGARFYDPALGRFVSADSVVPEPGNPQALNRYAYVLGNPLRYVDPTGHAPQEGFSFPGNDDKDTKDNRERNCAPFCSPSGPPLENEVEQLTIDLRSVAWPGGPIVAAGRSNLVGKIKDRIKSAAQNIGAGLAAVCATVGFCSSENVRKSAENVKSAGDSIGRNLNIDPLQIQSKFKHAADFGIAESYNKESAEKFRQAIVDHVFSATTKAIEGTYRTKIQVRHYFDEATSRNVVVDKYGKFISAWRLSEAQVKALLEKRNVQ